MSGSAITVVGGGLAGSEAAWQLAEMGLRVTLVDMKPVAMSPAHHSPWLGELVCSNSLRSDDPKSPPGLLKQELRRAGSLILRCADAHRIPAGAALAVDRDRFAQEITERLEGHDRIEIERRVVDELPDTPAIVATGPLTGGRLAEQMAALLGDERLYFYDAIAPIVAADSIDPERSFRASRWASAPRAPGKGPRLSPGAGDVAQPEPEPNPGEIPGDGDYVNCPLDVDQYREFVSALLAGRKIAPHPFEQPQYFEGCLPIEVMAERGEDVLRHGPMRPIGLVDPRTRRRPHAVVQLRPENQHRTAYNLVGFQTRLAYPEQRRIFSMIPALAGAEFLRMGSIHRNTYVDAPRVLGPELEVRARPHLHLAGLITGVEGYLESCAMGLLAARFAGARLHGRRAAVPPPTTALGGLYRHVTGPLEPDQRFAPSNINFGLLPPLGVKAKKPERRRLVAERGLADFERWWAEQGEMTR